MNVQCAIVASLIACGPRAPAQAPSSDAADHVGQLVRVRMSRSGDVFPALSIEYVNGLPTFDSPRCQIDGQHAPAYYEDIGVFARMHLVPALEWRTGLRSTYVEARLATGDRIERDGVTTEIVITPTTKTGTLELVQRQVVDGRPQFAGGVVSYCLHAVESGGSITIVVQEISSTLADRESGASALTSSLERETTR